MLLWQRNGSREDWWGMQPAAEGYLDQLITWREVGYNFCNAPLAPRSL